MAYSNVNLNQVLTQCHYDQNSKSYIYQEQSHVHQLYQLNFKAVSVKLKSAPNQVNSPSTFIILEAYGTIPVVFNGNTYNIPIKIHYLPGYPAAPPILIVSPSAEMMIKPSEYVQEDGIATLAILRQWNPRLTTIQMLEEAKKVFGIKMPVFKKPKNLPNFSSMPQGAPGNVDPRYGSVPYQKPLVDSTFNMVRATTGQMAPAVQDPRVSSHGPKLKAEDLAKIKEIYVNRVKELNSEIAVLTNEAQKLVESEGHIEVSINSFRDEVLSGQCKKEVLEASIKNTEDWIHTCSASTTLDVSEHELLEYRNEDVKTFLSLSSQEKALESAIACIIDALQKSVIPAKDSLLTLKQLYTDLFLLSRLKEKAETLAKSSN